MTDKITIERQLVERTVSALTDDGPPTQLITALRAALAAQPPISNGELRAMLDNVPVAQPAEPVACPRGHVWNDFGQLGGRSVSWCQRCDAVAFSGQEPSAAPAAVPLTDERVRVLREALEAIADPHGASREEMKRIARDTLEATE